jgi:hypothetical protein
MTEQDDGTRTAVLKEQIPILSKNIRLILEDYAKIQDGPHAINKDRFKEILKDSLVLIRCTKKLNATTEEVGIQLMQAVFDTHSNLC